MEFMERLSENAQKTIIGIPDFEIQIGEHVSTLRYLDEPVIWAFGKNNQDVLADRLEVFCKALNIGIGLSHKWILSSKIAN